METKTKPMAKVPATRTKRVPAKTKPIKAEPVYEVQEDTFFGQVEEAGIDILKAGKNTVKMISNLTEAGCEAMEPVLMELRGETLKTEVEVCQKIYDLGYSEEEAIAYITTGKRLRQR